jgi:hypothetical protein
MKAVAIVITKVNQVVEEAVVTITTILMTNNNLLLPLLQMLLQTLGLSMVDIITMSTYGMLLWQMAKLGREVLLPLQHKTYE